jgi:hypothetical protein
VEAAAIAVSAGRITAVGDEGDVAALIGPGTRVADALGHRVPRWHRHDSLLLPRAQRGAYGSSFLCTSLWMTCAKRQRACAQAGKCWDCGGAPCLNRASTCENTIHILCINEDPACPHAAPQWAINKPKVYRKFI